MKSIRDLRRREKALVQKERAVTMEVLRHMQEIERRKLYALKFTSLFDYAVRELGYSEAAASRRIQAMRLITELPEVAPKIESGALNLSNICQAQNFFRDIKKAQPEMAFSKEQKTEVLTQMEDKSAREGQKILLSISPPQVLPRERERMVSAEHTEVSFLINQELKDSLAEVRALLGSRGASLNLAELIAEIASLAKERLSEKRFGKARVQQARLVALPAGIKRAQAIHANAAAGTCTNVQVGGKLSATAQAKADSDVGVTARKRTRYISQATRHAVW